MYFDDTVANTAQDVVNHNCIGRGRIEVLRHYVLKALKKSGKTRTRLQPSDVLYCFFNGVTIRISFLGIYCSIENKDGTEETCSSDNPENVFKVFK